MINIVINGTASSVNWETVVCIWLGHIRLNCSSLYTIYLCLRAHSAYRPIGLTRDDDMVYCIQCSSETIYKQIAL